MPRSSCRRSDLRPGWFAGIDLVHVPTYSLLGEPLGSAGRRAIELARAEGAAVSADLSSIGPLLADGRRAARALMTAVAPDFLFATASEAEALLGTNRPDGLLEYARTAIIKRGSKGATVLTRDAAAGRPAPVRGRHPPRGRHRHDRRRRCVHGRVPRGLVRGPGRRPGAGRVTPAGGAVWSSGGGPATDDAASGDHAGLKLWSSEPSGTGNLRPWRGHRQLGR